MIEDAPAPTIITPEERAAYTGPTKEWKYVRCSDRECYRQGHTHQGSEETPADERAGFDGTFAATCPECGAKGTVVTMVIPVDAQGPDVFHDNTGRSG